MIMHRRLSKKRLCESVYKCFLRHTVKRCVKTSSVCSGTGIDSKEDIISFNDGKSAYRSKTTFEIFRALLVFRLCSFNFLVDNNLKVRCE